MIMMLFFSGCASLQGPRVFTIKPGSSTAAGAKTDKIEKQKEEEIIAEIELYYKQGKKSFDQGDYLAAIASFNQVIKIERKVKKKERQLKEKIDLHLAEGRYYYQEKEYQKAQEEFNQALTLDYKNRQALGYLHKIEKDIKEKQRQAEEERLAKRKAEKDLTVIAPTETEEVLAQKKEPRVLEYTIGGADVLYIAVWQEETLSQEVIVRPDGKISFPLVGDIPAQGLTFTQLKEELTQRLKSYIKYPSVSISLRKLGGKKVIVLGEVGEPGVYSVTGKSTALEGIALAGGFTSDAVVSSVIHIRGGFKRPKGTRLNLTRAIDKGDYSQNIALQPEDIIYVPKKFISNVSWAMTQLLGPLSKGITDYRTIETFGD